MIAQREMGNPAEHLRSAAMGDLPAQRAFVQIGLQMIGSGGVDPIWGYNGVLIWARIAAAHGYPEDRQVLAGCLCGLARTISENGSEEAATEVMVEAVAIADELADEGCELSAKVLNQLVEILPPRVASEAKAFRDSRPRVRDEQNEERQ
ncbi:hypothetical protein [Sphingobium vermicomposti]|uniref:Sel1 repeat family protein n=1 Tax=Sphingobium vermicomposti TaxID=529005 RepID=A0A846M5R7_9SPHN|nr:hypothetical protein [Sphingobium vermicomposti]NIJ16498.1 hypothetical protein [Sphingobium vermicomposti]